MKNPLSRRLFFWFMFCSFFTTTTIALLIAFGYRFDWNKKIFVHSGSITIKANPVKIDVKIDGKIQENKNSTLINDSYQINGLRPGVYDVEISAPDFKTWSKKIPVHSGVSTELWNVLLVRNNYERTGFNVPKIDNFFPAPQEFVFAYVSQQEKNLEVGVMNTDDNEITNKIVLENVQFTDNQFENIEWSPNNKALIVPVIRQIEKQVELNKDVKKENELENSILNKKDYLVFDLENNDYFYLSEKFNDKKDEKKSEDLGKITKNDSMKNLVFSETETENLEFISVRWSPKEKNAVYFVFDNELYLANFDLETKEIIETSKIYSQVLAYDFADDGIYILNENGSVLHNRDFKMEEFKELTIFEIGENKENLEFRLNAYDSERIVLLENKTGDCFIYNRNEQWKIYSKKLGTGIIDAHFSDDGKKLAFYSASDIFVYFTRPWETQPFREEDELKSITRFSKKIGNLHFAKDYEHLIFSTGNEVKIIEIYEKGQDNPQTITTLKNDKTKIISDHRNDVLYFLDGTENNNFFRINFPEETPILNIGG